MNDPYDFYFTNKLVKYSMAQSKDDSDDLTRVVEAHKMDNQRHLNTSLHAVFLLKSECSTKDHYRETLKGPWAIEKSWFVNRLHHYINFQKHYTSQGQIAYSNGSDTFEFCKKTTIYIKCLRLSCLNIITTCSWPRHHIPLHFYIHVKYIKAY